MPNPINSVSPNDFYWSDVPEERELHDRTVQNLERRLSPPCGGPESVLAGALCGDDTAVSNACRAAQPGSVDAFLCDDQKLERAQQFVQTTTWELLRSLVVSVLIRVPK